MGSSYVGIKTGKHALELGGGATIIYANAGASMVGANAEGSGVAPVGILLAGYRIHPVGGAGFNFRVGMAAVIGKGVSMSTSDPTRMGAIPWPYLSLGGSF